MVQLSLVCKQESDYFKNALQENHSNNTNTAEIEHFRRIIASMEDKIGVLEGENASMRVENENLKKEKKNDAKQIKRLENEVKSFVYSLLKNYRGLLFRET